MRTDTGTHREIKLRERGDIASNESFAKPVAQSDDAYDFDVVNEAVDKRLKFPNMCCSQAGCK